MMEEELERTQEKKPALSERCEDQDATEFDYEKSLLHLEIIDSVLKCFEENSDEAFYVFSFLSQFNEEKKKEVCQVLNSMADKGDICYMQMDGELYSGRIDVDATPNIPENICFRLGERPYGMIIHATEILYNQAEVQEKRYRENEKSLNKRIANLESYINEIKSAKDRIDQAEDRIMESENLIKEKEISIEGKIKGLDEKADEVYKKNNEKFQAEIQKALGGIPDKVEKNVDEDIDRALMREGKIGVFLENIQKDFLQYMGIFIAIFALVNLNLSGLDKKSGRAFLIINLSLVAAMTTLATLLTFILHRPIDSKDRPISFKMVFLAIFSLALWLATIYIVFR